MVPPGSNLRPPPENARLGGSNTDTTCAAHNVDRTNTQTSTGRDTDADNGGCRPDGNDLDCPAPFSAEGSCRWCSHDLFQSHTASGTWADACHDPSLVAALDEVTTSDSQPGAGAPSFHQSGVPYYGSAAERAGARWLGADTGPVRIRRHARAGCDRDGRTRAGGLPRRLSRAGALHGADASWAQREPGPCLRLTSRALDARPNRRHHAPMCARFSLAARSLRRVPDGVWPRFVR